jgi:hypothetical protein
MAYSVDLRERVIAYLNEGHTQEETRIIDLSYNFKS